MLLVARRERGERLETILSPYLPRAAGRERAAAGGWGAWEVA
jgi:hypothetical protein